MHDQYISTGAWYPVADGGSDPPRGGRGGHGRTPRRTRSPTCECCVVSWCSGLWSPAFSRSRCRVGLPRGVLHRPRRVDHGGERDRRASHCVRQLRLLDRQRAARRRAVDQWGELRRRGGVPVCRPAGRAARADLLQALRRSPGVRAGRRALGRDERGRTDHRAVVPRRGLGAAGPSTPNRSAPASTGTPRPFSTWSSLRCSRSCGGWPATATPSAREVVSRSTQPAACRWRRRTPGRGSCGTASRRTSAPMGAATRLSVAWVASQALTQPGGERFRLRTSIQEKRAEDVA